MASTKSKEKGDAAQSAGTKTKETVTIEKEEYERLKRCEADLKQAKPSGWLTPERALEEAVRARIAAEKLHQLAKDAKEIVDSLPPQYQRKRAEKPSNV